MKLEWFEEAYNWKNPEALYKVCIKQQKEIERLHSIIKEVREKIENTTINCDGVAEDLIDDIYEILDKENK